MKQTKTEKRVLQALYWSQSSGRTESGTLGTYDELIRTTSASRSSLLSTCQKLTQEGKIIRKKINATDRKRWGRRWSVGFARRQAYYLLAPETMKTIEADHYAREGREDDSPRESERKHPSYPGEEF